MEGCGEEQEEGLTALAAILEDIGDSRKSSCVSSLSEETSTSEEEEELEEQGAWEQDHNKLLELEQASQALLAELSVLEDECQIERSCRERAEVYAAQVRQENTELKRLSLLLLPSLAPEPLPIPQEQDPPSEPSLSPEQQHIRDLGMQVTELLQEKKELSLQVQELRRQLKEQEDQIQKERLEQRSLQVSVGQSQRALAKLKRVSHLVLQECGEALQQLQLEQDLRQQAESFAHKMLVEKKEAHRQSAILLQHHAPSAQLSAALEEVATLGRALEEAKRQNREQAASWEAAREEAGGLRLQLKEAEEKNSRLEALVCALQERVTGAGAPPQEPEAPPPAPPPPPPPLPPPSAPPPDPLQAIRMRRAPNPRAAPAAPSLEDKKAKAVQEMMDRIRKGVVLRPAARKDPGQDRSKRRSAAVAELQTILASKCRPLHRGSRRKKSSRKDPDSQLAAILQRRRHLLDSTSVGSQDGSGAGDRGVVPKAEVQDCKSQGQHEDWSSGDRVVLRCTAGANLKGLPGAGQMTLLPGLKSHQGTEHRFAGESRECPPGPAAADQASIPPARASLRTPAPSKASVLWGQPENL